MVARLHEPGRERASASAHEDGGGVAPVPLAARWRWYHFYFLLALLDLAVILASIALYHNTLGAYRESLRALTEVLAEQRWIGELRVGVVELNAPGNDVFESRRADDERARFTAIRDHIRALLGERDRFATRDLGAFERDLESMIAAEERVLAEFATLGAAAPLEGERAVLDRASVAMAAMDRFQARALGDLIAIENALRADETRLLAAYGAGLAVRARWERWFFAGVLLLLLGMFCYGRTLQRTHERMLADRQRAIDERRERLLAVGEVCAAMAHGLRNPLAGIVAAAQVAREEAESGALADALDDVLGEALRLEDRAKRLLDFSRPLAAKLAAVDALAVLHEVADTVRERAGRAGVALRVEAAAPPQARADRDLLREVVAELVANALVAMPRGGALCLTATRAGPSVIVRVADDGPGIPAGVLAHGFELFATTRRDGTGLGLATVKKLVELQGGRLSVESTGPRGTILRVELRAA